MYEKVFSIATKVQEAGGLALIVGGFARDAVMISNGYKLDPKDIDIEVYGIEIDKLKNLIAEFGEVNEVGSNFGVLKLEDLDISIPRTDSKTSEGHKGFKITGDPKMLLKDAVNRRDLTINALALNPISGEVVDVVGGIDDILNKKIRAVNTETFTEDPLRVLRVMQFAGRFDFDVEDGTKEICIGLVRSGGLNELPKERFLEEWKKLLLKSKKPSKGLEAARQLEIISLYPELNDLIGCKQEYDWHPEGDVWTHTLMVLDEAKKICERENLDEDKSLVILLAAICHDLGKPATTEIKEIKGVSRITAYGHEEEGGIPTRSFLKSIKVSDKIIEEIVPLVINHLFPSTYNKTITDSTVRRLAKKLNPASIKSLVLLGEADVHGRGYWDDQPNAIKEARKWTGYESGEMLLEHASKLADISIESPKKVKYITGKKLIELGLDQNKDRLSFSPILDTLENAQVDGKITGPEDLRLAKLLIFLNSVKDKELPDETLLTGEPFSKEDMIREVKDRFFDIGTHDMGSLLMVMILKGDKLPKILEDNKLAILTAHKYGPAWFKSFSKEFYEGPWKSFYGEFEVDLERQKEVALLDQEAQLELGVSLINSANRESIAKYNESYGIEPVEVYGKVAFYVTDKYPFEAGMMDGYEIMVQYIPEKKELCVSVMNSDVEKVKEIDQKIRDNLPIFKNAKKIGYLFASNENNSFSKEDGEEVFNKLKILLGEE